MLRRTGVLLPISFVLAILLWYAVIYLFSIPPFILPAAHEVVEALADGLMTSYSDRTSVWWHAAFTGYEAVLGYVIGVTGGILLAILLTEVPICERIVTPYIMAFQSLPRMALAPLLLIWFGFGIASKVAVIILLVFFPLAINTTEGLKGVDPDQVNLMRLLRASRWQLLLKTKLRFALPHIFSGLKLAISLSIVGAVVGEFIGGRRGLGVLLLQRQALADVAGVFAIFIVLSAMGALAYGLMSLAERRLLFWAHRLSME